MTFSVHPDEEARTIELRGQQPVATARGTASRVVFAFLADGSLREGECSCDARVCNVEDCVLDVGDADRAEIHVPVFPGGPPKSVSLGRGVISLDVPAFFDELAEDDEKEVDWMIDDTHLEKADRRCFGASDATLGFVCASDRSWCAGGVCSEEDVIRYAQREAETMASQRSTPARTIRADTRQTTRVLKLGSETRTVREFSAWVGRTLWRRSIVWSENGAVRERVCACGGNSCELTEETCSLGEH